MENLLRFGLFAILGFTSFVLIVWGSISGKSKITKNGFKLLAVSLVIYLVWFGISFWLDSI
jgi:hypothetical protein